MQAQNVPTISRHTVALCTSLKTACPTLLSSLLHRQCVEEDFIDENLRRLLPHDEGRPIEKPAEQALRLRM